MECCDLEEPLDRAFGRHDGEFAVFTGELLVGLDEDSQPRRVHEPDLSQIDGDLLGARVDGGLDARLDLVGVRQVDVAGHGDHEPGVVLMCVEVQQDVSSPFRVGEA